MDRSRPPDPETNIHDFVFHDARDVVEFAERAPLITGEPGCECWHLDRVGRFVSSSTGSARDGLRAWSAHPERLVRTYLAARSPGTRTPNWLVVVERPDAGEGGDPTPVELDVDRFVRLRNQLAVVGIDLVDVLVFEGFERWMSLRAVLTGSTQWSGPCPDTSMPGVA